MLGNTTSGKKPTKGEVVAPPAGAFKPAAAGGCGPPWRNQTETGGL